MKIMDSINKALILILVIVFPFIVIGLILASILQW